MTHFAFPFVSLASLWDHFRVTLGSFLVSESDFGPLWVHFEIIVQSLWVILVVLEESRERKDRVRPG